MQHIWVKLQKEKSCEICKLQFIAQCSVDIVGATIVKLLCDRHRRSTYFDSLRGAPRQRGYVLRIRIVFRQIRNIYVPGGESPPLHPKTKQNDN